MQLLCLPTSKNWQKLMKLLLRYINDKYIPQKIQHLILKFLRESVSFNVLLDFKFLILLGTVFSSTGEN